VWRLSPRDSPPAPISRRETCWSRISTTAAIATPQQGSLQIFNHNGTLVAALNDANLLDSPWDLTINDEGSLAQVFVSNVLSGTVTRLNLSVSNNRVTVVSKTRIGPGYAHQPDPAAVVVGPTGLAYDPIHDTLYVASTADNKIFAIGEAGSALAALTWGTRCLRIKRTCMARSD
jgi:DNA-binding beta-propeller fold protein YncE